MTDLRAGQVFACGPFTTTAHPTFDWETYSEAGYIWDANAAKWGSLPGLSTQNRGLPAVGARNYVQHPTFRILSLSYDLLDGKGNRHWVPPDDLRPLVAGDNYRRTGQWVDNDPCHPWDLITYVVAGGILEAWNSGFEWQVWNFYCVPVLGWPPLPLTQMRCAMETQSSVAVPASLL